MLFTFHRLRFHFHAAGTIFFPEGKPGNILRGAFGLLFRKVTCVTECDSALHCPLEQECPYSRVFEPRPGRVPSGLADAPRPFVFRASHLDGQTVTPGSTFHFDVNLFEEIPGSVPYFVLAFQRLALEGLGPRRGKARLERVELLDIEGRVKGALFDGARLREELHPIVIDLGQPEFAESLTVRFLTPTELKAGHTLAERPEFGVLMARIRDRVSTLRALYGAGPLELDFRRFAAEAAPGKMTHCEIRHIEMERTSRRTGQTHPLGGFAGWARYEGDLGSFVPFLRAACFTGVGRQTVWGKGEIAVSLDIPPSTAALPGPTAAAP